jgi:large subunit ribosomal protein L7Ae
MLILLSCKVTDQSAIFSGNQFSVAFLPALCQKMGVPFAIVRGQARLGKLVHLKTTTAVAITKVRAEDKNELSKLVETVRSGYIHEHTEFQRRWVGGIMDAKA